MQEYREKRRAWCLPARHVLTLLLLCAFFITQTAQVSLNIAIVAMVNPAVWRKSSQDQEDSEACLGSAANNTGKQATGTFMWDAQMQGLILGAMFYGSVLTHVFGGRLAEVWGGKWPFASSILVPALLCFLIPTAARMGPYYIFGVRVLMGLSEGVMGPAYFALLAVWAPVKERNTMASLVLLGTLLGTAITMVLTGYISSVTSLGGWPTVFYFSGMLGCVWFVFWALLVHNTPEEHPRISSEELIHIRESLIKEKLYKEDSPVPWRRILTSGAFWSVVLFRTSMFWETNTVNTAIPLYLETALHLPVEKNGLIMGLLCPAALTGCVMGGLLADYIRTRTQISVTTMHKGFAAVGMTLSCVCWVLLPQAKCDILWVFILLLGHKFFHVLCAGSVQVVFVDMAPEYAGTLSGILLTTGDSTGFLTPLLTGAITENNVSIDQWSLVFYVNVFIVAVGLLAFLAFGSAERQSWARNENSEKTSLLPGPPKSQLQIPF